MKVVRRGVVLLAAALTAGAATPRPSPMPAAADYRPCALYHSYSAYGCAAFRNTPTRVITAIPAWRFPRGQQPETVAVLADGSAVVSTGQRGLYRIVGDHITTVWAAYDPCEPHKRPWAFELIGSYDDRVVLKHGDSVAAVRSDGSFIFDEDYLSGTIKVVPADGIIWFFRRSDQGYADYLLDAYNPRTRTATEVDLPEVESFFGAPDGHAYAASPQGLYRMDVRAQPRARLVHGPIGNAVPQGFGPDGSLWASTPTDVAHVHRDGTVRVMRLLPPRTSGSVAKAEPISLTVAPDGSAWIGSVRITNDDYIERLVLPKGLDWDRSAIGPDSSLWLAVGTPTSQQPAGVVQLGPSPSGGGASSFSFEPAPPTPSPPAKSAPCGHMRRRIGGSGLLDA